MKKHFVEFYSPGTFVAEVSEKPIDSWDVEKAQKMAKTIKERYGATPYGFRFVTRSRKDDELDSSVTKTSNMYFVNCKVRTLKEIEKEDNPKEKILLSNMKANGWSKIVQTTEGWVFTQPLEKGDVVLYD